MSSKASSVPDGVFFELSPRLVLAVRVVNILVLLMVVITFILCLVRGDQTSAYYLLACNTVISFFVGIVVNWWYKSGDLGSEKFWYILLVAGVLFVQCITTDVFIFKVVKETIPTTTMNPINTTQSSTTTKSLLHLLDPATPFSLH